MKKNSSQQTPQARYERQKRRWLAPASGAAASSPWCAALLVCACGTSPEHGSDMTPGAQDLEQQLGGERTSAAYTLFEADPVRPVAVLEKSGWVAVANTVDGSVQLFQPTARGVASCNSVPVGLAPVAVAVVREAPRRAELWVVNHVSDSISVVSVDLDDCRAEVTRTLHVGDEPRDIVVASDASGKKRVFVATAHRGQHHPLPSARLGTDLVKPPSEKLASGLADVLVFDPEAPDTPALVNLFSDKPRALAVGDGVVYAASFLSGNRTTAIPAETATLRGIESLAALLARDEAGNPIEQDGELLLAPGAVGQVVEGGAPAVAGSGRCVADPRRLEDEGPTLQRLCVETDERHRVERVLVQAEGAVHPSCQCTSADGTLQPTTGVIVQFFEDPAACGDAFTVFPDGARGCWLDAAPGGVSSPAAASERQSPPMAWNAQVKFSLPDQDVFAISIDELRVTRAFSGVGTVLFGLAVQPGTGALFVTNTEAKNLTRFEGHGRSSSTTVIGHLHESRITVIDPARDPADAVTPRHLNSHIDYSRCCEKDPEENAKSFAFPTAGVFSRDGERFFFTALGSDKIGVVGSAALRADFDHDAARAAGALRDIFLGDDVAAPSGPVGLALDARRQRLYVKTHFDNALIVVDAERERIQARVRLPSPEPASVTRGRSVLYNARLTSSHGDSACASCHVFGDFDGLAWDLGDPDGETVKNPGPFALPGFEIADFRSNKGPMSTQTLRGLANHGALHWRGDRTRNFQDAPGEQPDVGAFDELRSFTEFDVAIASLNGNDEQLDPELFRQFAEFALQLTLPPNPVRNLDDTLTAEQASARALYFGCASMTDAEYEARTCTGLNGAKVEIEQATRDCLCVRNPIVDSLRDAPRAAAFSRLLAASLTTGDVQSALEARAVDTSGLPQAAAGAVLQAAAALRAGIDELLVADLELDAIGLLSPQLSAALSKLSGSLAAILAISADNGTSVGGDIAALLFESLPSEALPPEVPRDPSGLLGTFDRIAQIAGFSELARVDELSRGTSDFRNVLSGCDLAGTPACNLRVTDSLETCHGCHRLDPDGNSEFEVARPGFFGTDGEYSFEGESQVFKIPQLRNLYQKVGMFGAAPNPFFLPESVLGPRLGGFFSADTEYTGPQVRGSGFFHDGVVDTLHRFHGALAFIAEEENEDGLDAFLPRPEEREACVARFRAAPEAAFASAPEEQRPFLALCIESGPLPEACFLEPGAPACQEALAATGEQIGVPQLPAVFERGLLPLCFQLGSMLEGGSADGVCHPAGLRERAALESFMLAFDTNLKPMVGQQLTLRGRNDPDPLLAQLLAAALRGDCDLSLHQRGEGHLVTRPNPAAPLSSRVEDRRGRTSRLGELAARPGALTLTCHPPAPERAEARGSAFGRGAPRR